MFGFERREKEPATTPEPTITKEIALAFLQNEDLTVEDISELAIKTLGPLFTNERLSKQDEFQLFNKISELPHAQDYMRDTMSRDLKRFFAATDPRHQDQIRGAHMRVLYFMSLMNRKDPNDTPGKLPQLGSDRYAGGAD